MWPLAKAGAAPQARPTPLTLLPGKVDAVSRHFPRLAAVQPLIIRYHRIQVPQESFGRPMLVQAMVVVALQIIYSHAIARASRCTLLYPSRLAVKHTKLTCRPKPCNVGTGFNLRVCIHDLDSECREYTDPTCSQIGACHDVLAATNGVSSYIVSNGCCDFYGSRDCSGSILNGGCNQRMPYAQLNSLGLNDKLNSAKCRYP